MGTAPFMSETQTLQNFMHLGSGKKRNFWYLAEGLGG